MQNLLAELQRRKVLRFAATYLVGSWIVLQVAVAVQTAMVLSASFSGVILALIVIAFPLALALSWFFEITPEGIRRTAPASGAPAPFHLQTTDLMLAGTLALVILFAIVQLIIPGDTAPPTTTADVQTPKAMPPLSGDKSIAVLPFANMSPDKDDEFFADGLTEEILNALSQIQGLRVISRTSSFAFKGKNVPLPEIAKQLSVRYLLEGSVRRQDNDIRITAQLIDVSTDAHIWSKTFEPKLQQVFVAQAEIARAIALALEVEVDMSDAMAHAPTANMEAYGLFLKGREMLRRGDAGDFQQAIELLERAIALDPKFVQARVALTTRYMNLIVADPVRFKAFVPKARVRVAEIRKLDPDLPAGSALQAVIDLNEFHWAEAIDGLERAVAAYPSNASVHLALATFAMRGGLLDRAKSEYATSTSLDPLNRISLIGSTYAAFARGDDQAVLAVATMFKATNSEAAVWSEYLQANVAQQKGDHTSAERHFRAYMAARGRNKSVVEPVARALKSPGAVPAAVAAINKEWAADPAFLGGGLLGLIDPGGAMIDALQSKLEDGDTYFVSFSLPTVWREVVNRGANPKIKKLFRDTGLVDYWRKHGWPDRCRAKGKDDFECS